MRASTYALKTINALCIFHRIIARNVYVHRAGFVAVFAICTKFAVSVDGEDPSEACKTILNALVADVIAKRSFEEH